MKTSELTGAALDWAVAQCENDVEFLFDPHPYLPDENGQPEYFTPSTDWAQGGPIIERERIAVWWEKWDSVDSALPIWAAVRFNGQDYYGPTPLVAAMRCYVASGVGDEIEVPEELGAPA